MTRSSSSLRHLSSDGHRDRHRPRRGVQDRRGGAAPADGQRSGQARGLDARGLGADVTRRRVARSQADAAYGDNVKDLSSAQPCCSERSVSLPKVSFARRRGDQEWELTNRDRAAAVMIGIRWLRRRADLGRQRHLLRAHAAGGLPAARAQSRGNGHLPCGSAALRRGSRPLAGGKRRLPHPRLAAARLDPGRAHRWPADGLDFRRTRSGSFLRPCSGSPASSS